MTAIVDRGMGMTADRLTVSELGINKRPYPTGPVDTTLPVAKKYRWRGGCAGSKRSKVSTGTKKEICGDYLAIFGEAVLLEKVRGSQEWTIVKKAPVEEAAAVVEGDGEEEGPQSGSASFTHCQKAESEPVEGVRRSGRKRKRTEKALEPKEDQPVRKRRSF